LYYSFRAPRPRRTRRLELLRRRADAQIAAAARRFRIIVCIRYIRLKTENAFTRRRSAKCRPEAVIISCTCTRSCNNNDVCRDKPFCCILLRCKYVCAPWSTDKPFRSRGRTVVVIIIIIITIIYSLLQLITSYSNVFIRVYTS